MVKRKKDHTAIELEDSLSIFQNESDRACATLGSAHLEFLLKKVIETLFINNDELRDRLFYKPNAPLGTFSSRIDVAYGLNIIKIDILKELNIIREIRNAFAHSLDVHSFNGVQSIKDSCLNLSRAVSYANSLKEPFRTRMLEPRNLYIYTVIIISDDLKVMSGMIDSKPNRPLLYKSILKTNPGDHFYTISSDEKEMAVKRYGYKYESIECYVIENKIKNTVPLYRLFHSMIGDHFYTVSVDETEKAIRKHGYVKDKIECYVFLNREEYTVPLYRLYNPSSGDHFYTISSGEQDQAHYKYGYIKEGIACYVYTSAGEAGVPFYRLLRTT